MEEVVKRHTLESFREKLQLVLVQGTSVRGTSVRGTSVRGEEKTLIEPPSS
jgi:hypothetical protein